VVGGAATPHGRRGRRAVTNDRQTTVSPRDGLIMRATAVAVALTVLGSVLGLGRDLLLARYFGATGQTDAFLVAWTVPETASPLLIEGAMAYLMIPIFVVALGGTGLAPVVRSTLPRIAGLLGLATAVIWLAAPLLVRLMAPGLADAALAVRCTRLTAVTVLAFGLAGYLGAALRSAHVFGWPSSIYVAYNVGIVGAIVLLHERLGVLSAAIGVAVGSAFMIGIQLPSFLKRLRVRAGSPSARVPRVALAAFIPIAVFTVTRQAQVFVERFLGSELSAGTISHLNYAQKVAQVPMVLAVVFATVTFPLLARSVADGDQAGTRARTEWDLRVVSAAVLVASAYLIAFARPIIRVLFEHGAFTSRDTADTTAIMRVYAFGLLGHAAVGVLSRSYYSDRRPVWYPALAMAAGLAVTALTSVALLRAWHGVAIAAGNAVGITVSAGLMLSGLRNRSASVSPRNIGLAVIRLGLLAGAAGLAGWTLGLLMVDLPASAAAMTGAIAVGGTFVLLGAMTGVEEIRRLGVLVRSARNAR